jgi:hypothetical protein
MTALQPRYSKEEFARRGTEIYEQQVRSQVEEGNHGKIVAIDIETGAFEMAEDTLTASEPLLARYPDAQIWCVRIGHPRGAPFWFASNGILSIGLELLAPARLGPPNQLPRYFREHRPCRRETNSKRKSRNFPERSSQNSSGGYQKRIGRDGTSRSKLTRGWQARFPSTGGIRRETEGNSEGPVKHRTTAQFGRRQSLHLYCSSRLGLPTSFGAAEL